MVDVLGGLFLIYLSLLLLGPGPVSYLVLLLLKRLKFISRVPLASPTKWVILWSPLVFTGAFIVLFLLFNVSEELRQGILTMKDAAQKSIDSGHAPEMNNVALGTVFLSALYSGVVYSIAYGLTLFHHGVYSWILLSQGDWSKARAVGISALATLVLVILGYLLKTPIFNLVLG